MVALQTLGLQSKIQSYCSLLAKSQIETPTTRVTGVLPNYEISKKSLTMERSKQLLSEPLTRNKNSQYHYSKVKAQVSLILISDKMGYNRVRWNLLLLIKGQSLTIRHGSEPPFGSSNKPKIRINRQCIKWSKVCLNRSQKITL